MVFSILFKLPHDPTQIRSPPSIKEAPANKKDHEQRSCIHAQALGMWPTFRTACLLPYPHDPRHGVTSPVSSSFHNFDLLAVTRWFHAAYIIPLLRTVPKQEIVF